MADAKDGKEKALELAILQIEKSYGKGSIMRLGSGESPPETGVISTGALGIDIALGIGGVPRGRVVEIFGPESSGKTTLALHIVAEAQKTGGIAAFIDAEHALDLTYARALGVRTDDLLISQPDTGEQALEIAEMLVRSGAIDVVVVDSVAALVPARRDRGRDGRCPRRSAGAPDVAGAAQAHRRHRAVRTRPWSSSTRSARRSASCSAAPRPRRAAAP